MAWHSRVLVLLRSMAWLLTRSGEMPGGWQGEIPAGGDPGRKMLEKHVYKYMYINKSIPKIIYRFLSNPMNGLFYSRCPCPLMENDRQWETHGQIAGKSWGSVQDRSEKC